MRLLKFHDKLLLIEYCDCLDECELLDSCLGTGIKFELLVEWMLIFLKSSIENLSNFVNRKKK